MKSEKSIYNDLNSKDKVILVGQSSRSVLDEAVKRRMQSVRKASNIVERQLQKISETKPNIEDAAYNRS